MKIKTQPIICNLELLSTPPAGEESSPVQKTKESFFKHPRQYSQKTVGRFYQGIKEDTADVLAEIRGEYTLSDDECYESDSDSESDEVRTPAPRAWIMFRPADKEIVTDEACETGEEYKAKI